MAESTFDIHLVCGATGAGKSTYAENLAQSLGGLRFSIDEWMQCLHNADQPSEISYDWLYERVLRNCAQMRDIAEKLAPLGIPSIFDCGLTKKEERTVFTKWAANHGFSVQLHFIDIPTNVRWQRVQKRNTERKDTFQFEVTREMFDFIDAIWEAPSPEEMQTYAGKQITS